MEIQHGVKNSFLNVKMMRNETNIGSIQNKYIKKKETVSGGFCKFLKKI